MIKKHARSKGVDMEILQRALIEAIEESMGFTLKKDNAVLKRAFCARISLDKSYVIVLNKAILKQFSLDFLGVSEPKEDELVDITKEISNIIAGKAKVIYEESGAIFKLGIPQFIGYGFSGEYKASFGYKYKNMRCSIYEV